MRRYHLAIAVWIVFCAVIGAMVMALVAYSLFLQLTAPVWTLLHGGR